ncbi:hypothetical protein A2380_03575 [candidate division WWE3 bacterium RIFOXYB1_FULL_43_24]|uniref:SGNH hydrolase-type esterase domain-containing protein n=2 Tax=Katanobacteria TaxID=422282 RepID=A0A0G1AXM1_UNCKA|nr:MAG: hypothetical protein UU92_C0006G0029 [candidate division WWE3 bacterium GW2011_GWA1_42_12]KKS34380.1 MAG: hypothetical protein UU97_C0011G0016 [candidate division WWE3 bacterium GW2011_GWD1_42_14]KKS38846.1 MAG: hypothetical protein UV00_C0005G0029 [candidate division WWE3 bacterium GW2011_GWF1_42_14]KKS40544.1 MAG: hypothetical protein UV03_C0005G0030 [candidate division WWE3 bacterium GW2011_GWE1_42_16]KKS66947.1 MAG: hypothetical protein UV35_C0005G0028 [candidate division WWE3 bacte
MKFIKFALPAGIIILYLYLAYAGFYNTMKEINLQSPYSENLMVFGSSDTSGSVKYVALGDSLSAGVGSDNIKETIVYQFAFNLFKKYGKVSALNLALPGGTTEDVIKDQLPIAISENPAYVTLLIGINDIHNKFTDGQYTENYSHILNELLTKTDAKIIVINLPYLGSPKAVRFPYNWMLNSRTKEFNSKIYGLISEIDHNDRIRQVDLYGKTYKTFNKDPKNYSSDLFHPSGQGYLLWSRIINED